MNEIYQNAHKAIKSDEVLEAARTLAKYNLGVFIPHMHDEQTGELSRLPSNIISYERDLKITFVSGDEMESSAIPVGWRWNGNDMEICAGCCVTPQK